MVNEFRKIDDLVHFPDIQGLNGAEIIHATKNGVSQTIRTRSIIERLIAGIGGTSAAWNSQSSKLEISSLTQAEIEAIASNIATQIAIDTATNIVTQALRFQIEGSDGIVATWDNFLQKLLLDGMSETEATAIANDVFTARVAPRTVTFVTGALAPGAKDEGVVTMPKTWIPIHVATTTPAEVRVYQSLADQVLDASRITTEIPEVRMLQCTTTQSELTLAALAREVMGTLDFSNSYPITVISRHSSITAISVTIKYISLED